MPDATGVWTTRSRSEGVMPCTFRNGIRAARRTASPSLRSRRKAWKLPVCPNT